jgi:hypothetical protein
LLKTPLTRKFLGLALDELAALLIFVAVGGITVWYHEPWADEAQAWLIARDLTIPAVLSQMRYEGSPALWHLLLWPLIRLHMPYAALGFISLTLMIGAMYIWLRYGPVPRVVRLLVPFTFYYQYQYTVVARSYALATLLAFVAVALWRAKPSRILELGVVVALLAQTNLFGFMIAAGIVVVRAAEYFRASRQQLLSGRQTITAVCTAALIGTSFVVAKIMSTPPPDYSFAAGKWESRLATLSLTDVLGSKAFVRAFDLTPDGGALLLFLVVLWFVILKKRVYLLPFLLTVAAMEIVWWKPWHSGMILTALLVSLWTAWPEATRLGIVPPESEFWTLALQTSFTVILILQVPLTLRAVRNDICGSYSGAKAAAEFLKPYVGKRRIYSYEYRPTALLPYFDANIFANRTETFWTWNENHSRFTGETELPEGALVVVRSGINSVFDPFRVPFEQHHIQKKQTFCGYIFWFNRTYEHDCYDVYEQQRPADRDSSLQPPKLLP